MTTTVNSAADTGLPEATAATLPLKPSLVFMSDDLNRILRLTDALRAACSGQGEDALCELAHVLLEHCEAFHEKFEDLRAYDQARA